MKLQHGWRESRTTAERDVVADILPQDSGSNEVARIGVLGTLHCRWHADRGIGVDEELQAHGRIGVTTTGRGAQSEHELQGSVAQELHPRLHEFVADRVSI